MKKKCVKIGLIILLAILFITIFIPKSYTATKINPSQITGEVNGMDDNIELEFRDKVVNMIRFIRNISCSGSTYGNRY